MISVIIPTYNRPKLIGTALRSVLDQTINDLEIIVVDGSKNNDTREQICKINDSRIKYLKINNVSAANSRNIGIDEAKGDLIAFNDDDDIWCNNKIERQLDIFKKRSNEKIVVYSTFIRSSGKHIRKTPDEAVMKKNGDVYDEILLRNFVGLPTVMLPLSCCQEVRFDEQFQCLEDWDWMIRLAKKYPYEFIEEELVSVGDTPMSVNKSNYSIKASSYKIIYKKYYDDIRLAPHISAKHLLSIGSNLCLSGDLVSGRRYLLRCIKLDSKTTTAYICYLLSFMGRKIYYLAFKSFEEFTCRKP